jgi:hypothetical protein
MDTNKLKKFAQAARNLLIDQVTSKLDLVLDDDSAARRENPKSIQDLEGAIRSTSRTEIIEQVAYTWFNRFTALRFMDVNGYTSICIVSPTEGQTRPEILSEAMAGHIDDSISEPIGNHVLALLDGRTPSTNPQAEAYRLLLVASCNQWDGPMPFLFETIDDYTELLMPEDLLSQTSILAELREVMIEAACQDVEIIGWLYQFYISEKKDQVFAGLKKNQKITPENIPAATQLFTPHWIVRYLVENSLGRLWLLNRPQSKLSEKMEYYIAPEEPETDFLEVSRPEEIRICDPACGSGHMLTYAFDLLYAIYEEEGYDPPEIPGLILTHNLYGVEIDDRAGALAAFALAMKAAAKLGRRRFLRMEVQPNICVLQNVSFAEGELHDYVAEVGSDLFTADLRETLGQFSQAKNFGSLIVPALKDVSEVTRAIAAKAFEGNLFLREIHERVLAVLRMAEFLSSQYHVVVANPPYMGRSNMNLTLSNWLRGHYEPFSSDLFSASVKRFSELLVSSGSVGFMTPNVWMSISTHEALRLLLTERYSISNLVELPLSGFKGATVQICAFTLEKGQEDLIGNYIRLVDFKGGDQEMASFTRAAAKDRTVGWRFGAKSSQFAKISGSPISYFVTEKMMEAFAGADLFEQYATPRQGLGTTDNGRFVRAWAEISFCKVGFGYANKSDARDSEKKWFPYSKGGGFRRWFGNDFDVINWENDGAEIRENLIGKNPNIPRSESHYFKEGITWGLITSANFSARLSPQGGIFDVGGSKAFPQAEDRPYFLGYLNSSLSSKLLKVLNPTLNFQVGDLKRLPIKGISDKRASVTSTVNQLISFSKSDWDAYETSWDFTKLPLLQPDYRAETLEGTYTALRTHWQGMTDEMRTLEEENNRIFIDAYGLQDELTPEVPLNEITLTCNPAYRYGIKKDAEANETRLRADTMAEFLSYAVACMFGRYSLDEPGLILANQGDGRAEYLAKVPQPTFEPDDDNVIPILDGDWFPDDITERFRKFLRITFGEEKFRENLNFIEDALGKDIRKYFTKDFYANHVKRYKKRPIYWMFSSPKGTFNTLIYMHRYRPDTVSVVLNDYLREFISKLGSERTRLEKQADDQSAAQSQRTKALKDAANIAKQLDELHEWEREVMFPLAQQQLQIDLDDGVKANYPKFGSALRKVAGLS